MPAQVQDDEVIVLLRGGVAVGTSVDVIDLAGGEGHYHARSGLARGDEVHVGDLGQAGVVPDGAALREWRCQRLGEVGYAR